MAKDTMSTEKFEFPLLESDGIVISISAHEEAICGSKTRVWRRGEDGIYRQIGLIAKLKLKATSKELFGEMKITVPEDKLVQNPEAKKRLQDNKKFLKDCGVIVKEAKLKKKG